MGIHEFAGTLAKKEMLENIPKLVSYYYSNRPNIDDPFQRVSFGTSGHRGSSMKGSFNEDHILAIVQSICDYRQLKSIRGPLFLGMDTHALSEPAMMSALEVLAANNIYVMVQSNGGYTPTPVISHAILTYNMANPDVLADGIVITPSHNPPADGGIKYNSPSGGPADTDITDWIASVANDYLIGNNRKIKRIQYEKALKAETTHIHDYIIPYVHDLVNVIDVDSIANSKLRLGADALGGSGLAYWDVIAEVYGFDIDVINSIPDPTFQFMTLDKDGKIRMDCSSEYAMASLIQLKDKYDIAFGNDPDFDRHGIVVPTHGLLNPNHYLSVAIDYLFKSREGWNPNSVIGKTLVSSSMIDRVALSLNRSLSEVPVGFKWFVNGLLYGTTGFGGEESAGASFLRKNGAVWTTDKDGFILNLLAAEMTAITGYNPGEHYDILKNKFGDPIYKRIDAPATPEQKQILKKLSPQDITVSEIAGEKITSVLTNAPGNNASIGGLKVTTENAWFAARPSGTEDVYKIYAESFNGEDHLSDVIDQAQSIVRKVFDSM